MIQEISAQAYFTEILPTLSDRHQKVLQVLSTVPDATNSELSRMLGWEINRGAFRKIIYLRQLIPGIEAGCLYGAQGLTTQGNPPRVFPQNPPSAFTSASGKLLVPDEI